ncbi:hypothetical protein AAZX31_14G183300 [Glycine max]
MVSHHWCRVLAGSLSSKSCTYCGKDNHTVGRCYRKSGFPPNYTSRGGRSSQGGSGRGSSNGKGNKVCTHCGFTNHIVDECYRNMDILLDTSFTGLKDQMLTMLMLWKKKVIALF